MQPVLGRGGDPGLVGTLEGIDRLVDPARRTVRVLAAVGVAADSGGTHRERSGAGDSEEPPARERSVLRVLVGWSRCHRVMAPVILERGSARALVASESCLRCSGVTLS